MLIKKVGIIGMGVLGTTHYNYLKEYCKELEGLYTYDINPDNPIKSDDFHYLIENSQVIFINLPTPKGCFGRLATMDIEMLLENIFTEYKIDGKLTFIIRSTMPIHATECISSKWFKDKVELYYMPEFLTERFAKQDFEAP
jgi:UDP-glucose 6-dehydrogenase